MKRLMFALSLAAVLPAMVTGGTGAPVAAPLSATSPSRALAGVPSGYILGPDDQISLVVTQLEEEFGQKTFRVDQDGDISIPMIGRVHAGGVTAAEFENRIRTSFSTILKHPDIVVSVTEFSSQPVSVLGAVNSPGVRQLQGGKTLFEVLSLAGGLRPDAGTTVKITRDLRWGAIQLIGATVSRNGQDSVVTVHLKDVMEASAENIVVRPGDTVFVPKADMVYVVGSITRPGGFPIGENESLSALQLVALAEGIVKTAAANRAKILRVVPGKAARAEIPINLRLLMEGKGVDMPMLPEDILFVPGSAARSAGYRTLDAIVNAATGLAIYTRY